MVPSGPQLPVELWECCVSFLANHRAALAAVCRTLSVLRKLALPYLYQRLGLWRNAENDERTRTLQLQCRTLLNDQQLALRCTNLDL